MNRQPTAALAVARLQNRSLPLDAPRDAWPALIDRAAELLRELEVNRFSASNRRSKAVQGTSRAAVCTLVQELRRIAAALRGGR